MEDLLERYEAYGDENVYAQARRLYEQALAGDGARSRADRVRLPAPVPWPLLDPRGHRLLRAGHRPDPQDDQPHWQLIAAMTALGQAGKAIDRYQQRLAAAPADPRAHRFLASAYLHARDYDRAAQVIRAGLELAPDDPALTGAQGDLLEAAGRPDDALACWRRAATLAPDNMSPHYAMAFRLERQDRLAEAAAEWRLIISWCDEHGHAISADWPRRMLQGLEARLAGS